VHGNKEKSKPGVEFQNGGSLFSKAEIFELFESAYPLPLFSAGYFNP